MEFGWWMAEEVVWAWLTVGIYNPGMPAYAYVILAVGWILWFLPFPLTGWKAGTPVKSDRRARWGLSLEVVGYTLLWQGPFWVQRPSSLRVGLSIAMLVTAALLSWTSTRALGRHLRFDAALSVDHRLVRSGPYRMVRHPVYASMLCLLLGTGFMVAGPWWFAAGLLAFVVGTEIRVKVEDGLLAARFGEEFREYQRSVPAYIPYLR
jgi:protein-S-isoprenylcysteine O-methyltransferase Ste14